MKNLKHPHALVLISICYALFMAAFCGILASLTLYQTNELHMPTDTAYGVFAAAMALLWILPLAGGYLAGKLGYMSASYVGLIICVLGMACFCFNSINMLYLGLALFVVGNAYATPAIWCVLDHCYAKDSSLREAGFTLFYLIFNFGAVVGIFMGGYLADKWGFSVEFGLDTVCLILATVSLLCFQHRIESDEGRSIAPQVSWSTAKRYTVLVLIAVIGTPFSVLLFNHLTLNNVLMLALMVFMVLFLMYKAFKLEKLEERNRLLAFIFLSIISVVFWILYSLEPSFLSVYVQNNVNTTILGIHIPAASYYAFDGVFVIIVGLILSRLWLYLSMKHKNPALSLKFASSLILIGLGFMYLAWMVTFHKTSLMPGYQVVIAYAIFATAELLVSPLGISMVGLLAPAGEEGLLMGFAQLATGVGGVIAGYIAMAPHLPDVAEPLAKSNPVYFKVFLFVGLAAVLSGVVVLFFVPALKRLMKEHAYVAPQV